MRRFSLIFVAMTQLVSSADDGLAPPSAKIVPKTLSLFGDTRIDNYYWLRERTDPDTIQYLEAENAYTQARMKHTVGLQTRLYAEMLGRIQQTDSTVPIKIDNYFYYRRTIEGKQYEVYCRKKDSLEAPEEVLLDGNALAEGHKYFNIGPWVTSPDHRLLAYGVDLAGDETYTVRVKDLTTGQLLPDEITNAYDSLVWANDNRTFFYTVLDKARRPFKVFRHTLGTRKDPLVYHEKDERFTVEVAKTSSRAYILINIASSLTTEVRYLSAGTPRGRFQIVLPRVHEVEYDLTHHGNSFFIRTNDGAKTFRVVEAPVSDSSRAKWKEVIPSRPGVTIESVWAFKNHLVVEERDGGLIKLRVRSFSGGGRYVEFDEPAYRASLGPNAEYETPWMRFVYTSLVVPDSTFDYNMDTGERILRKRQPVLGGYDPAQYVIERLYAKAADGVEIPISVVYKKDTRLDGSAPLLLYGYGAYGISIDPSFSSDRLSLLDRGMIFAIAHIRGGGDLGKQWHENGRLLAKRNTFTDFIACAEYLIAQKYTAPSRLAIHGRSAGGLLIGSVVNMRPELFAAAVAMVPFVDAVTTELDATLPLTVGEWEEWGNPSEKQYYDYMKSYSPYDNIAAQRYPAMLVTAGLNDPRVMYWEPAKWVAKLRASNASPRLLLKTEMGSGHFGSSGRYDYLKETAFYYAFILDALGLAQ
jgi:oligopeptidase B